jgi:hypothetical protein
MGAMTVAGERSGVLVVRAWIEGEPAQLKARITQTIDLARREPESATVSSGEEIEAEVRRWLAALESGGSLR